MQHSLIIVSLSALRMIGSSTHLFVVPAYDVREHEFEISRNHCSKRTLGYGFLVLPQQVLKALIQYALNLVYLQHGIEKLIESLVE